MGGWPGESLRRTANAYLARQGVFSVRRSCRPLLANDEGAEAMNQQNNNQNPSQQQREQQQREQQNQQNQGQKPGQPGQKPGGQHSDKDDHNRDNQKR